MYKFANLDVTKLEKVSTFWRVEASIFLFVFCVRDTYLLTPQSRVLLEKVTGSQLVKKLPTFYGTRWFITAFASARHLFLS